MPTDQFQQLVASKTVIVADTGDIEQIRLYKPTDATTNPSLILKAAQDPKYAHLIDDAVAYALKFSVGERLERCIDRLAVNFGTEIAAIVPGVVSTEVDARLSYKPNRTIQKARRLIQMYKEKGVDSDRILIKIAATWQGIRAAEILEREGIHCNLTLLFSHEAQAVACAEAGVTLISPFVGRITDWYKKDTGTKEYAACDDPGVQSVAKIYNYYKKYGYKTVVMGASFRNKGQITALAGCDKLTIGPKFLKQMKESHEPVVRALSPPSSIVTSKPKALDDRHFYMRMCKDPMATTKLAEGIRGFIKDTLKLESIIKPRLGLQSKL
jgi:transaldolase